MQIQQSASLRLDRRNRELQSFWCDYQLEIWDELKVTTSRALAFGTAMSTKSQSFFSPDLWRTEADQQDTAPNPNQRTDGSSLNARITISKAAYLCSL